MAGDGVERRGLMFVLSSPSGAGKSTLARELMSKVAGLQMSVAVTTRPTLGTPFSTFTSATWATTEPKLSCRHSDAALSASM